LRQHLDADLAPLDDGAGRRLGGEAAKGQDHADASRCR